MRMPSLQLARSSHAEALLGPFVCLKFWHYYDLRKMFAALAVLVDRLAN